jgi:hypothetical protein
MQRMLWPKTPDICKGKAKVMQVYNRNTKKLNESDRKTFDVEIQCIKDHASTDAGGVQRESR